MTRLRSLSGRLLAAGWLLASVGCTSILGDFSTGGGSGSDASASSGFDATAVPDANTSDGDAEINSEYLGTPCTTTADCLGGSKCADSVCCESSCDGVCEACNLPGSVGQCAPIPMNTDPDLECVSVAVPDAGAMADASSGAVDGGDAGDASGDAGDAGGSGAASDGAVADAATDGAVADAATDSGPGITLPEGGITVTTSACAGTCSGQRSCAYPGSTTSCGTQFCATASSLASLVCNGQGGCELAEQGCGAYACESTPDAGAEDLGACVTSCSQTTDCNAMSYCDGQQCQPQLGVGVACTNGNGAECQTGFCASGYCCATACDDTVIPGATCAKAGSVGTCTCSLSCDDGGSCQLFYRDADGDGFGNELGTIANGDAVVGCSGAPPTGYVSDDTDCDDMDANAFPGQSAWFTTQRIGGGWDYNCDGTDETEYTTYPYATCTYCNGTAPSCSTGECGATGDQAYLTCGELERCFFEESVVTPARASVDLAIEPIGPIGPVCSEYCGGATNGFVNDTDVACGQSGTYETCGTCSTVDSYAVSGTATSSVLQGCH